MSIPTTEFKDSWFKQPKPTRKALFLERMNGLLPWAGRDVTHVFALTCQINQAIAEFTQIVVGLAQMLMKQSTTLHRGEMDTHLVGPRIIKTEKSTEPQHYSANVVSSIFLC